MKPRVSVVITTKNEEKYIERCLKSIKAQTYENLEIIVSDACSSDRTVEIAKKYADKVLIKRTNIPEGRNLGAKHAEGEILVFIDADTILSARWIERAVDELRKGCVMCTGKLRSQEKSFKPRFVSLLWGDILPMLSRVFLHPLHPNAAGFAISRRTFWEVNGYEEKLPVLEDVDFCLKIDRKGKIAWNPRIFAFTSMRRFKRKGYLKFCAWWFLNFLTFFSLRRLYFKTYRTIR